MKSDHFLSWYFFYINFIEGMKNFCWYLQVSFQKNSFEITKILIQRNSLGAEETSQK